MSAYSTPTASHQVSASPDSARLDSLSATCSYLGIATPTPSGREPSTQTRGSAASCPEASKTAVSPGSQRACVLTSTDSAVLDKHTGAYQEGHIMAHKVSGVNGFETGGPEFSGSPILGRHQSQGSPSGQVLVRQASTGQQSQRSPILGRQPSLGQAMPSSPVLSRHPSISQSHGSPVLGRHPSVSQLSPGFDRHATHSGYTTPDERHGNLSRQSSSSGCQGPPTPSFPVSPALYQETGMTGCFRQGSATPTFQPQLPEKRRMSSGDRPNATPSYGSLNGKLVSPASPGTNPGYFHTLSDFSRFNMAGKESL